MDANHPNRKAFERFSLAASSAAEERWIESHLRSGCRVCQREVDDLLSTLNPSPQDATSGVQDLQARAGAYLGNARRIAFALAGAEEALLQAERLAEGGSADPLEEARILDLRASLLGDQGRFEQAAELLDIVIDIYDDLHEPHRKGRAMISQGGFLGQAGDPEEAIRQLR